MRNDQMWPLHLSWVSWLQSEAEQRALPLAGVALDDAGWSGSNLDDARAHADRATIGQRLGCGRVYTHLMFWRGTDPVGAWLLTCAGGDDTRTERSWQVLLLETLVLSAQHPAQDEGVAAK